MDKLIYTGDQDSLLEKAGGQLWQLIENEKHVKQAASSAVSEEMLRNNIPDDDHYGTHWIAMGAGEHYGFNRNGDHFPEEGLMHKGADYGYETFLQGHHFREHRNRDPKLAIGVIKAACYNPDMHRLELITWTNKRKAPAEYEEVKQGKQQAGSMSCKIEGDRCSICDNFAKSSKLYCDDLKYRMNKWDKKHQKFAYAINPKPRFFDFSKVANQADRIALGLENLFSEKEMQKAAAFNGSDFLFSDLQAKMAGVCLPTEMTLGCSTYKRRDWLEKLAAIEDYIGAVDRHPDAVAKNDRYYFLKESAPYAFNSAITDATIDAMRKMQPDVLFSCLAKSATVLPFTAFYAYVSGKKMEDAAADPVCKYARAQLLPTIFQKTLNEAAHEDVENYFVPADSIKRAAYGPEDPVQKLLDDVADNHSISPAKVQVRILHICASSPRHCCSEHKEASAGVDAEVISKAETYANAYALYKVAFVEHLAETDGQEIIDDPGLLLLTFQNKL